ncbi:MAG TPA: ABC transporter permease [Candidatus Methylomirabilis sp.]
MNWAEIYRFRYFLRNMVARDLKIRYKGSVLGFLWSLMNPFLMMIVLSVVFSMAFHIDIPNYPIFLLCALLPWNFFAASASDATGSIIAQADLIKKVPFPREILPLATILTNLVHFGIGLVVLFAFLIVFRIQVTVLVLGLPLVILIQTMFLLGFSLILSCLNVFYRDVQHILGVLLMVWFYLTPIFYSLSMIPPRFRPLYLLNPMASLVTMYRALLFESRVPPPAVFAGAVISSLLMFLLGNFVFRRHSFRFAEEL